jgi:hypothetical protein
MAVCRRSATPAGRVVAAGLAAAARPDAEVQLAIDAAMLRERPKLLARTPYLPVLGNLSVLSGIHGTITGMIRPTYCGGSDDPSAKTRCLAEGISEALNCTAFGLAVAIMSVCAYFALRAAATRVGRETIEIAVRILNLVTNHRDMVFASHGDAPSPGEEIHGEILARAENPRPAVDITVSWNDDVLEIMRWRPRPGRPDVLTIPQVLGAPFARLRVESDGHGNFRWTYGREPWPKQHAFRVTVTQGEAAQRGPLPSTSHVLAPRARSPFARRASSVGALAMVAAGFSMVGHIVPLVSAAYTFPELGETWESYPYFDDGSFERRKTSAPQPELALIRMVKTAAWPDSLVTDCPPEAPACAASSPTRHGKGKRPAAPEAAPPLEQAVSRRAEIVAGLAFDNWLDAPGGAIALTGLPHVYVVRASDSLSSIARREGFAHWRCFYNRELNAALVRARPNPDRIHPGDRILLPTKCSGNELFGPRRRSEGSCWLTMVERPRPPVGRRA